MVYGPNSLVRVIYVVSYFHYFFFCFQEQSGRGTTKQAPTDQRHKRTRGTVKFGCGEGRRCGNGSGFGSFSTSGLE